MNPELHATLLRLNARAWGIATGLMFGLALFVATNVLVLKGGEVIGYGFGRLIGEVYNRAAHDGA
jgi:hypothetical protein